MSTLPPCAGLWEVFDSTDEVDHRKAKTLCGECSILTACAARLESARKEAHKGGSGDYGPQGTWAGQLIGAPRASEKRIALEDAMFTDDEVRAGHSAWVSGVRTERNRIAERVYQRKRSRRRYAKDKTEEAA